METPSNPEIPEIGKFHFFCHVFFFSFKILFHRENSHLLGRLGGRSQYQETPNQIGRVGTYIVCSKSYDFSLPKLEKLSSESEELQEISLDDK